MSTGAKKENFKNLQKKEDHSNQLNKLQTY